MERINCLTAGCMLCSKSGPQKRNYFGEARYTCGFNPKAHKEVNARKCNMFRCCVREGDFHYMTLCRECRKGK